MGGFIEDYGHKLEANGYDIFPMIPRSKRPAIKWTQAGGTYAEWLAFKPDLRIHPESGISFRAKHNPAVDIDVRDTEIAAKVFKKLVSMFGSGLSVRMGQKPKLLVMFKTSEPFKKQFSKKYVDVYGDTHQVEILGDGQYFVGFGIHPATGKNFVWKPDTIPSEIPREDLPELTKDKAQEIIKYFESVAPDDWELWEKESDERVSSNTDNPLLNVRPKTDLTIEEIHETVGVIDPDINHNQWVRVGMGLYHQFDGSDEGFNIWDEWSASGDKYDPTIMSLKWDSFNPKLSNTNPVTFSTVIRLAKEYRPDDYEDLPPPLVGFKSMAEIAKSIGSVKWLIRDWIEDKTISCIFGDPGSYKSFIALDQAFVALVG